MTRTKTRDLTAVLFVGLFLLTKQPVFLWLLVGAFVFLRNEGSSYQKVKGEKSIIKRIQKDARLYSIELPKKQHVRALLIQVYEKYDLAIETYPHLKPEYEEIMTELWCSLQRQTEQGQWESIVTTVIARWPDQSSQAENPLQKKLKEVADLTKKWDEAQKEAFGGAVFRQKWDEFEAELSMKTAQWRDKLLERLSIEKQRVDKRVPRSKEEFDKSQAEFKAWGEQYIKKLQNNANAEKFVKAKDNFFVLLRNLGINDELLVETFNQNRKEILDPMVGEAIAIVSLVLGWKQKDKEAFSQALGEIGVVGVFAAKPFICLIAICGLAYGYHRNFHKESFKKGGVLGLAGLTAAFLTPGGFVGLLAAIVTMIYFNKKLSVDKPIETQLKEIFKQVRSGEFFREVRQSWKNFEDFLSKILRKDEPSAPKLLPEA